MRIFIQFSLYAVLLFSCSKGTKELVCPSDFYKSLDNQFCLRYTISEQDSIDKKLFFPLKKGQTVDFEDDIRKKMGVELNDTSFFYHEESTGEINDEFRKFVILYNIRTKKYYEFEFLWYY